MVALLLLVLQCCCVCTYVAERDHMLLVSMMRPLQLQLVAGAAAVRRDAPRLWSCLGGACPLACLVRGVLERILDCKTCCQGKFEQG